MAKITQKEYDQVFNKDKGRCHECGTTYGLEYHHVIFKSKHVPNTVDNGVMLCSKDHRGTYGVHGKFGKNLDLKLKLELQNIYKSRDLDFNEIKALMGGRHYSEDEYFD